MSGFIQILPPPVVLSNNIVLGDCYFLDTQTNVGSSTLTDSIYRGVVIIARITPNRPGREDYYNIKFQWSLNQSTWTDVVAGANSIQTIESDYEILFNENSLSEKSESSGVVILSQYIAPVGLFTTIYFRAVVTTLNGVVTNSNTLFTWTVNSLPFNSMTLIDNFNTMLNN